MFLQCDKVAVPPLVSAVKVKGNNMVVYGVSPIVPISIGVLHYWKSLK
jgi:hypothetical protein